MPLPDLSPFQYTTHIQDEDGYIVWRRGTGDNVELLHIKAVRAGGGTRLLRKMLDQLRINPPYATVFGFTRTCNAKAREFYANFGFDLTTVDGVYDDGAAVVFSARYDNLCLRHNIE